MVSLPGIKVKKILYAVLLFCSGWWPLSQGLAWNATGHRLAAQIAYDNLTSQAKERFNGYNHALDKVYRPLSFVNASIWLDILRGEGIEWYEPYHYIDIFYTTEDLPLPPTPKINAIWALEKAVHVLKDPKVNEFDKGISYRIILHVIADVHQPMHAVSRVSAAYPQGDKGGNEVQLGKNSVAHNLHAYWDLGGGAFSNNHYSSMGIGKRAAAIEENFPCKRTTSDFSTWADESHAIAVEIAYNIASGEVPSVKYQRIVRKLSEQRIAQAGCRTATLLNRIARLQDEIED
jgi:hypothetical protein